MAIARNTRLAIIIIVCGILYVLFSLYLSGKLGSTFHRAMGWNMFLAMLPVCFAIIMQNTQRILKGSVSLLGAPFWLIFFSNAPYMVTDLIHIRNIVFYDNGAYSTDIWHWIRLTHLATGAFLGVLAGTFSLYLVHHLLIKATGQAFSGIVVFIVCILSGYGIYVGRFLRINSWDVMHPYALTKMLVQNTDSFSIMFSLLMALYILLMYLAFYFGFHKNE